MGAKNNSVGKGTIADMAKGLKDALIPSLGGAIEFYTSLVSEADKFNNALGNNRARIIELQRTIGETTPQISRLGGSMTDVTETMSKIAESSRRSVIANTEDITKLYAATKVLGIDAKITADNFLDVGIGIEQVGKNLEKTVQYTQSIGGNTVQVFKSVEQNMSQLNRYQFEGGVQGLTKMAAQASMLRFDMNQTFTLADKVLTPEHAIETASAFQRLGVSVGGLADPFQLMNQAINDPSGLQDSLVNVSKQFTYFDEKTKTFKINPQGVLTLKEMQQQTGVSAAEMTKLGLAAAEAEKRMSEISPSITFKNEEDKQYLSNISKMSENGKYQVEVTDEKGKQSFKDLADVTQGEMDKLIERQKDQPKTIEEIARAQMNLTEIGNADLRATKEALMASIATTGGVLKGGEDLRTGAVGFTGSISDIDVKGIKAKYTEKLGDTLLDIFSTVKNGTAPSSKQLTDVLDTLKDAFKGAATTITEATEKAGIDLQKRGYTDTGKSTGAAMQKGAAKATDLINGNGSIPYRNAANVIPAPDTTNTLSNQQPVQPIQTNKTEIDGNVTIHHDIKIEGAQGLSADQLNKALTDTFNTTKFQDYIKGLARNSNPTKTPAAAGYNPG